MDSLIGALSIVVDAFLRLMHSDLSASLVRGARILALKGFS